MNTRFSDILTFVASVAVGCAAAIAGAAVVSQSAPALRGSPAATAVVRLDPIVVTVSKATFDAVRTEQDALARANAARKAAHG